MAERRIIVFKEIKFHGSKHKAGVDVFKEPEIAEKICEEVGICLTGKQKRIQTTAKVYSGLYLTF